MAESIPIYNAPIRQPEVPTSGIEQLARAGARLGQIGQEEQRLDTEAGHNLAAGLDMLGRGVNEAGQQVEQHENTADRLNLYHAQGATLGGLTEQFNQFMQANAGDPHASQNFVEQFVAPLGQKLEDAAQTDQGRVAAAKYGADLADHFTQLGSHTQGAYAAQNAGNLLQQGSASFNQAIQLNPGNLPLALRSIDAMGADLANNNPSLSPAQVQAEVQKRKSQAVIYAGDTYITKSLQNGQQPDVFSFLGQNGNLLDAPARETLERYQDAQIRLTQAQQKANVETQQKLDAQSFRGAVTDLYTSTLNPTSGLRALPSDYYQNVIRVGQMAGAEPGTVKAMIDYGQSVQTNTKRITDPTTYAGFAARMFDPSEAQPIQYKDIFDAAAQGKLSDHDLTFFKDAIDKREAGERTGNSVIAKAAMSAAKSYLHPTKANPFGGSFSVDPVLGSQNYSRWVASAVPDAQRLIANGTPEAEAWQKVTDPKSYLPYFKGGGSSGALGGLNVKTPATISQDQVNSIINGGR